MLREPCTFLIPVFNGHKYLESATQNILEMAGLEDEILYVNDGSTDQTIEDWNQLLKVDGRIRILHQPHRGIVAALNNGVAHSTKDFLARVDIDDSYSPDRINRQFEAFYEYENCGAVFCDYEFIDATSSRPLGAILSAVTPELSLLSLVNPQRMPHPGALIAKHALINVGGYMEKDFPCEDYGLWLRLASKYTIVSVPETLLNYSISNKSLTALHSSAMSERMRLLQKEFLLNILLPIEDEKVLGQYFNYSQKSNSAERKILTARDLLSLLLKRIRIFKVLTYFQVSADLIFNGIEVIPVFIGMLRKRRLRNMARKTAKKE